MKKTFLFLIIFWFHQHGQAINKTGCPEAKSLIGKEDDLLASMHSCRREAGWSVVISDGYRDGAKVEKGSPPSTPYYVSIANIGSSKYFFLVRCKEGVCKEPAHGIIKDALQLPKTKKYNSYVNPLDCDLPQEYLSLSAVAQIKKIPNSKAYTVVSLWKVGGEANNGDSFVQSKVKNLTCNLKN